MFQSQGKLVCKSMSLSVCLRVCVASPEGDADYYYTSSEGNAAVCAWTIMLTFTYNPQHESIHGLFGGSDQTVQRRQVMIFLYPSEIAF